MTQKVPVVEQYMTRSPHVVAASEPLQTAHDLMRKYQIRHLPVARGDELVGVVSMGDLHLLETLEGVDIGEVRVEEAMSSKVYTVQLKDEIPKVAAKMAHDKLGSAVVLDGTEVVGIFTTTDALIALLHAWK